MLVQWSWCNKHSCSGLLRSLSSKSSLLSFGLYAKISVWDGGKLKKNLIFQVYWRWTHKMPTCGHPKCSKLDGSVWCFLFAFSESGCQKQSAYYKVGEGWRTQTSFLPVNVNPIWRLEFLKQENTSSVLLTALALGSHEPAGQQPSPVGWEPGTAAGTSAASAGMAPPSDGGGHENNINSKNSSGCAVRSRLIFKPVFISALFKSLSDFVTHKFLLSVVVVASGNSRRETRLRWGSVTSQNKISLLREEKKKELKRTECILAHWIKINMSPGSRKSPGRHVASARILWAGCH